MVVTVTAAFSLLGYCRMVRERIAWRPAIRITRLTTMAMTGRRMNRSVNFICSPFFGSLFGGFRRQLSRRREGVVDAHRHAIAQLEGAAAHHRLAGIEPRDYRDEIPAALADSDKPLLGYRLWLAGRILGLSDDEHGIAVGGVDHAGRRNHRHLMLLVRENLDVREHARREPAIRVVQGRSETHVSRGDVDLRVDHADLPLPARAGKDVKLDPHALPYLDVGQRLLRQGKLDVDRRHLL